MGRLSGKTILITGSTSGIGRDIAQACVLEGANVIVHGRNKDAGEKVIRTLAQCGAGRAAFLQADIRHPEECTRLVAQSEAIFGPLNGLVNNAGLFPRNSIEVENEEQFDEIFNVNVKGAFFCTQAALCSLRKNGGGSILNIGSTHAFGGEKGLAAYGISKGALLTMTYYLARNYAREKIRANWITVGWVLSEGERRRLAFEGFDETDALKRAEEVCPLGRIQTGEDIGLGAVFLLSDEAEMITGTVLEITGGFKPLK